MKNVIYQRARFNLQRQEESNSIRHLLIHQNSMAEEQIYVASSLQKSFLGQPEMLALDLVARIQALQEVDKFVVRFP